MVNQFDQIAAIIGEGPALHRLRPSVINAATDRCQRSDQSCCSAQELRRFKVHLRYAGAVVMKPPSGHVYPFGDWLNLLQELTNERRIDANPLSIPTCSLGMATARRTRPDRRRASRTTQFRQTARVDTAELAVAEAVPARSAGASDIAAPGSTGDTIARRWSKSARRSCRRNPAR